MRRPEVLQVAEILIAFTEPILADDNSAYLAGACGGEMPDGLWEAWIEFTSIETGDVLRSGRETTQPNRQDALYWATGLTPVYLEGALKRARTHHLVRGAPERLPPTYDRPAESAVPDRDFTHSILNPFSVYRKGEPLLRRQLQAFSEWHLINIIRDFDLSAQDLPSLEALTAPELVELIVAAARARSATAAPK